MRYIWNLYCDRLGYYFTVLHDCVIVPGVSPHRRFVEKLACVPSQFEYQVLD